MEMASKIGHIKLIENPTIRAMLESFESIAPGDPKDFPPASGNLDLSIDGGIQQVIVVDGGHQIVPNKIRPERQIGFIQVAAMMLKLKDIQELIQKPLTDPRDVARMLHGTTYSVLAALPIAGVHLHGHSIRDTSRESVFRFLETYGLLKTLSDLVYRRWETNPQDPPHMNCLRCGQDMELPRFHMEFSCPGCSERHRLSDYLGLFDMDSQERGRAETISGFRTILEALTLFSFILRHRSKPVIMGKTLFLLDGPLTLRAGLSRLVEPIRSLLEEQKRSGNPIYLLGVEKSGDIHDFASSYGSFLPEVGDYFIPSTQFIVENIRGQSFSEGDYRNRVNYGAKAIIRISSNHLLVVDIPTGKFLLTPTISDLIGFSEIAKALSKLQSSAYPDALIPIVMANSEASISNQPSNEILSQYVDRILNNE